MGQLKPKNKGSYKWTEELENDASDVAIKATEILKSKGIKVALSLEDVKVLVMEQSKLIRDCIENKEEVRIKFIGSFRINKTVKKRMIANDVIKKYEGKNKSKEEINREILLQFKKLHNVPLLLTCL